MIVKIVSVLFGQQTANLQKSTYGDERIGTSLWIKTQSYSSADFGFKSSYTNMKLNWETHHAITLTEYHSIVLTVLFDALSINLPNILLLNGWIIWVYTVSEIKKLSIQCDIQLNIILNREKQELSMF